ncbi:MAG: Hint domain-containing protein [Sulfitobacter sp.]
MPDYTIYTLGEGDISISGGGQLDGVTQGDGSHLNGLTITLNSDAWTAVAITDNDNEFEDNDGNQRLNGTQTIDGTSYADGTGVEAEYGIVVTDGTNSWTLVGFNVNNSSPSFGTIEGLSFVGGPGGFPPIGVPLTVTSTFEGPSFASEEYATPICLVAGTMVETAQGHMRIEDVAAGERVRTRDNGMQTVRWAGHRSVRGIADFAPVRIEKGAVGNSETLWVSQQHRVLLEGWQTELLFGQDCMLVPAVHLINDSSIRIVPCGQVTYVHLLFDHHEMIMTEGCWTESLLPGPMALDALLPAARAEVVTLFPYLEDTGSGEIACCGHPVMRRHEARMVALNGTMRQKRELPRARI